MGQCYQQTGKKLEQRRWKEALQKVWRWRNGNISIWSGPNRDECILFCVTLKKEQAYDVLLKLLYGWFATSFSVFWLSYCICIFLLDLCYYYFCFGTYRLCSFLHFFYAKIFAVTVWVNGLVGVIHVFIIIYTMFLLYICWMYLMHCYYYYSIHFHYFCFILYYFLSIQSIFFKILQFFFIKLINLNLSSSSHPSFFFITIPSSFYSSILLYR